LRPTEARTCGSTINSQEEQMQARTSTWSGSPEAIERWVEHVTTTVKPMVAGLPGNAGAYFFVDRANHLALTLTLWKSEEAVLSSDQTAEASRASTVAATGVELVKRDRYEVVTQA
jgi:heme-degrading monooxygenase HmoA